MNFLRIASVPALALALGSIGFAKATASPQPNQPTQQVQPPGDDTDPSLEGHAWPEEPKWRGSGPMPRHYLVAMWGIPKPYESMTNPLRKGRKTLKRGKAVYMQHCASCHGEQGAGDGEAGRDLSPSPGNLVWLSDIPEKKWDAYMYWSTAEGGIILGTAMPAFKDSLSSDDIWAVAAYIQANLPFVSQWRSVD